MFEDHYPGVLGQILVVHAPYAVHVLLKGLTPILPERITKRIRVVASAGTPQLMQELVDPACLPRFLGGDVEDKLFISRPISTGGDNELSVPAGSNLERGVKLNKGDMAAFGCNVAEGFDISFSCRFEPDANEADAASVMEVCAPNRLKGSEGGSFTAPCLGRLVLLFDNSYSWLNPKTITYELQSETPEPSS